MQLLPQRVGVGPPQPLAHTNVVPLPVHTGSAVPQIRPQTPQFVAALRLVSQPLVSSPSQLSNPASHVMPHETPSHVVVALSRVGQGVHELPQRVTSMLLTHAPEHR